MYKFFPQDIAHIYEFEIAGSKFDLHQRWTFIAQKLRSQQRLSYIREDAPTSVAVAPTVNALTTASLWG